ncbi:4'-phosphopantetheinyl transferase family protein [Paraburkholderia humisilvae]|nr:4'-phosphopantetheinyl transferase superfamily protein [Paraburkholderia humisilvae]
MPELPNYIDLWFVDPDTVDNAAIQQITRGLLSADELAQSNRFRFPILRRDYLITRWLVRTILSERLSVPGQALHFAANRYGRPYLPSFPDLSFNISHTSRLIVLAVAAEVEVGVDVEHIQTDRATPNLAEYSFAVSERAALRSVAPNNFDHAFFSYWTLKESYVKALGTGLSTALDSFSFSLEQPATISFTSDTVDPTPPHFWLLQPSSTHLCAICVRRWSQQLLLRAWTVVSLTSRVPTNVIVLRRSTFS